MSQTYQDTQHICPACSYGPFVRNNYFTGKLLVERDFTDETRFHMEKMRHHEQLLHGWGVVCGLKVKPHPNEACRDRFICIEPGFAVDCCGHDIIVREEEGIDLWNLPESKAIMKQGDTETAHKLQVCIRFRECPTESIPVLYDECGCDETKCAPNRILESWEVGVILDPKDEPPSFHTPRFEWANTLSLAHAKRIALHEATHRAYVVTADSPATIYQVSTDNHATIASRTLAAGVVALAVSKDGSRLYVVTEPVAPDTFLQFQVIDTTPPGLPDFNTADLQLADSAGSDAYLEVAANGILFVLLGGSGDLLRGPNDLDTNNAAGAPQKIATVAANVKGLAISSDGDTAFSVGGATKQVHRVKGIQNASPTVEALTVSTLTSPALVALVRSTAQDMLVVSEETGSELRLVSLDGTPAVMESVALDHEPVALVVSPGGHWAYVLETDGPNSFVQPVSLNRLQLHLPAAAGAAFQVGNDSSELVLNSSGDHLYIPFTDSLAPTLGGVAIIEVSEAACSEILWRHLDGCSHCDQPDCVVLATIENYNMRDRLEFPVEPADPAQDTQDKIARINNRTRRLLPGTQALAELVECLLEHGTGGAGTQGPPGPPGKDGKDGKDGTNGADGEDGHDGHDGHDGQDGQNGTNGQNGAPGKDGVGLELGLTRIKALSWTHNEQNTLLKVTMLQGDPKFGFVIGFTDKVIVKDAIDAAHIFQVLVFSDPERNKELGLFCRCPLNGTIIPVKFTESNGLITNAQQVNTSNATGIAFLLDRNLSSIAEKIIRAEEPFNDVWIQLRGDFVKDEKKRAIDAEFVRAQLPTGDRPDPLGLPLAEQPGIQGGLFESWSQSNNPDIGGCY